MPLNVAHRLLVIVNLLNFTVAFGVEVTEVMRVQEVVFDTVAVVSQTLNVVRPDEPFLFIFLRHSFLNCFQVVIRW